MKKFVSGFLFACGLTAGTPAYAAIIDSAPSGLLAPVRTVTFAEVTFADGTPISTEYASYGVSFAPNLYYRNTSSWEPQGINGENLRTGDPVVNVFSMKFDTAVSEAAFASIASPSAVVTLTARLGGIDIESFTTTIDLENNSWLGFTGIQLDEINISYPDVTRLRIDNIQLGAAVPEPGVSLLAGLGVMGLAARRRRTRN